jgi:hypothetical protein
VPYWGTLCGSLPGSWYLDHRGRNTTLWPDHTWKFRRFTRRFHPGEYIVRA